MQSRQLSVGPHGRTIAVVLDTGDDFTSTIEAMAGALNWQSASFTGIGAFERITLGYFQWDQKSYKDIPLEEQVEVASLVGNIACTDDGVKIHAHVVVGTSTGTAHAGHLRAGTVRPTLELVIEEAPSHLQRHHDSETGLALLDLDEPGAG